MEISRQLNLVQTVETDAGPVHLHSTPISFAVWETYHRVLVKTHGALSADWLAFLRGTHSACLLLKDVAEAERNWSGPAGVENGLLAEIRRLSNVVMPGPAGWQVVPYEAARQSWDEETVAEVEGALIFFICASAVLRGPRARKTLQITLDGLTTFWDAQTTSLDATAFAASLPMSMPAASSGASPPRSSVPH